MFISLAHGCASPAASGSGASPHVREWKPKPYPSGQVNLIAMGDWGTNHGYQHRVAETMAAYVEGTGLQFHGLLSLGDNFYRHVTSVHDDWWRTLFEEMYDHKRLAFPFYAVLGNHDYEFSKEHVELAYAKENPRSRWRMPARWYRIEMPEDDPIVTVLMLDSNKNKMSRGDWQQQLQWLGNELARPRKSRWTIACAHHPLFSNGSHGDNRYLQREWGTLFQKFKLDFYLCGHDHDLQHLQFGNRHTSFILAGGGGQKPRGMSRDDRGPFSRSENGFAHLKFTADRALVRYVDGIGGKTLHLFARKPDGTFALLDTTGTEPPTTAPAPVPPFEESDAPTTRPVTTP